MAATVSGAALAGIYSRLNSAPQYHPLEADTFADWSLEAGDIVTVSRGDEDYVSPVHSTRMVWKGSPQVSISSTGNKERESVNKVSKRKYGRGSGGIRNGQEIHNAVYSEDGILYSLIEQTASSIRTEVGTTISGMAHSIIEQTATYIRTEVENAASSISASVIEQTAEYVRTEVSAIASGVAWSVVEQTMTGIIQEVHRKSKIYVQYDDPDDGINVLYNGDIWIKQTRRITWDEMGELTWNLADQQKWKDFSGPEKYVWRDTHWVLIGDESVAVDAFTRVEQDDERWRVLAQLIDSNGEVNRSNLTVTAREISTNVENVTQGLQSSISQTASQIRAEVKNTKEGLQSSITQTASQIRAEVKNTKEGLESSITQTASSIRLEVSSAKSNLYSVIEQTSTRIFTGVYDKVGENFSTIEQTASSIKLSVNSAKSSLHSAIEQTATRIFTGVYDKVGENFSTIEQTASQISTRVGKGEIISSINQTAESITIQASKIDLDGYVKATDLTTSWFTTIAGNADHITMKGCTVHNSSSNAGLTSDNIYFRTAGSGGSPGAWSLKNFIKELQITQSGNTYKLQKKAFNDDDWVDVGSFSRATTLSGAWSGSKYTVTASPQGNTKTIGFSGNPDVPLYVTTNGTPTSRAGNEKWLDVPLKVYEQQPNMEGITRYEKSQPVNATAAWQKGYDAGAASGSHSIDIPTTQIYVTSNNPQGTKLTRLRNLFIQAQQDSDYVCFRVDCGGTSKWYYMEP